MTIDIFVVGPLRNATPSMNHYNTVISRQECAIIKPFKRCEHDFMLNLAISKRLKKKKYRLLFISLIYNAFISVWRHRLFAFFLKN